MLKRANLEGQSREVCTIGAYWGSCSFVIKLGCWVYYSVSYSNSRCWCRHLLRRECLSFSFGGSGVSSMAGRVCAEATLHSGRSRQNKAAHLGFRKQKRESHNPLKDTPTDSTPPTRLHLGLHFQECWTGDHTGRCLRPTPQLGFFNVFLLRHLFTQENSA